MALAIALSLRLTMRKAGGSSARRPILVRSEREFGAVETPAYQRSSGASARVAFRPLLRFVRCTRER
jgi:hypothetical protein